MMQTRITRVSEMPIDSPHDMAAAALDLLEDLAKESFARSEVQEGESPDALLKLAHLARGQAALIRGFMKMYGQELLNGAPRVKPDF